MRKIFPTSIQWCAALVVALNSLHTLAAPQAYPVRSVEWVVPFAAGGVPDVVARAVAGGLSQSFGQHFAVRNRPELATQVNPEFVKYAKADGYVVLSGDMATLTTNPLLYTKHPNTIEKDFIPVGLLARAHLLLVVNPRVVEAKTWPELYTWLKRQPGAVMYASSGGGSPLQMAMELLQQRAGLKMTHVPYRGVVQALQGVVSGHEPMMWVEIGAARELVQSGKLRAIALASNHRLAVLPNVPTLAEQGLKGFEVYAWQGLVTPKGTPPEAIERLNGALMITLNSGAVKSRYLALGLEPLHASATEMALYLAQERGKWRKVIQDNKVSLE